MAPDTEHGDDDLRAYVTHRTSVEPPPDLADRIVAAVKRTPQSSGSRMYWSRGRGAAVAVGSTVIVVAVMAAVVTGLVRSGIGEVGSVRSEPPAATGSLASSIGVPTPKADSATATPTDPTSTLADTAPTRSYPVPTPSAAKTDLLAGTLLPVASWTLLIDERGRGEPGTIEAATTEAEFGRLWTARLGTAPPQPLGPGRFAIFFEKGTPADCTGLALTGLEFDVVRRVLYGVWSVPGPADCTSEIGSAHMFVVVVDRAAVASGHLRLRLSREPDFPCGSACGFSEEVGITL